MASALRSLSRGLCPFLNKRAQKRPVSSFAGVQDISVDEVEVRAKYKTLGSGEVQVIKTLDGPRKGVAIISLANPERKNALSGYMMVKLAEILDELEIWMDGKALILHGVNGTFCSGADLSLAKAIDGDQMCAFMQRTLTRLRRLPLISVAAVEGKAIGGGAELATACDFRLMSSNAEISHVQIKMGVSPGWGGGARLVRLVGRQRALQMLGTAEKLNLKEAIQCGLVDKEIPQGQDVVEACCEYLEEYLIAHPSVIRAIKGVVAAGDDLPLAEALQIERSLFTTVWGGDAHKQALKDNVKHR